MTKVNSNDPAPAVTEAPRDTPKVKRGTLLGATFAAGLLLGGGSLVALSHGQNGVDATPLRPTSVATLKDSRAIAAKGEVAEIFGNKFILQDPTGRALVDTGRDGEGTQLVRKGETLAVEGRFDQGVMHAANLTHDDGRRVVIGPTPPGPMDRLRDHLGIWPQADVAALTTLVRSAGYDDVRIAGRGPHHLDVVAKGKDGQDHDLHVDLDGGIEDRALQSRADMPDPH